MFLFSSHPSPVEPRCLCGLWSISFPSAKRHCACERTSFRHPRGHVSHLECPMQQKEAFPSKNKEQQHSMRSMSKTRRKSMLAGCLTLLSISHVSTLALSSAVPATSESSLALWNFSSLVGESSHLTNTTNVTNSSTMLGNRLINWRCETVFGISPHGRSCFEAVRRLAIVPGSATRQFTWGPRSQGFYDVPLPQRMISPDGHCLIQVTVGPESPTGSFARASQLQVQNGAAVVVNNCMIGQPYVQQGSAWNFNDDGNIEVDVIPGDSFFDGECYGTMPPLATASCRYILNHMSTSLATTVFGPNDDPESTTLLPYTVVSPDGRCALTITTTGPEDESDWYTIWNSAVFISGICVAQGKQGRQTRLGDKELLTVELSDPSVATSSS
ncbi:hypothetical protein BDR22DRAFT_856881 [Usnea florida]